MRKIFLIAMLVMVTGVPFYACQDNQLGGPATSGSDKPARIQACNFVTLSGCSAPRHSAVPIPT